jgi:hypothetical protein
MGMMPILSCGVGAGKLRIVFKRVFIPSAVSGSHGEGRSKTLDGKTLVVADGHPALSFVSMANALAEHAGGWCGM